MYSLVRLYELYCRFSIYLSLECKKLYDAISYFHINDILYLHTALLGLLCRLSLFSSFHLMETVS